MEWNSLPSAPCVNSLSLNNEHVQEETGNASLRTVPVVNSIQGCCDCDVILNLAPSENI